MSTCDRLPRLLRLRDAGDLAAVDAHLGECPACAEAWRELESLTALGRELPDGRPDDARRESVRTRILAQAAAPRRRHPARLVALAAAAAIGAWVIGTWLLAEAPSPIGRIASAPGAIFSVRKADGVEWIRLDSGRITIRVPTLEPDQRLVVVTEDAEVEVRGTVFTVEAADGRLRAVEVEEGVVEVRPAGTEAVRLRAHEQWQTERHSRGLRAAAEGSGPRELRPAASESVDAQMPPDAAAGPAEASPLDPPRRIERAHDGRPAAAPAARGAVPRGGRGPDRPVTPDVGRAERPDAGTVPPTPDVDAAPPEAPPVSPPIDAGAPDAVGPSPQTARFEAGWTALRAGRPAEAAPAFEQAAELPGPLSADARWWRAVALGRAGDDGAAREAVVAFLARHPTSARRHEAAVMLGWLDFAAGRVDAAEASFRRGLDGRRPAVRASAREGLDAVAAWRAERR